MIETPALSAVAAAMARLQRHPTAESGINVAGAVVVVVDREKDYDAMTAVAAIGQALRYRVAIWSDGTADQTPDARKSYWDSVMTSADSIGAPALLASRATATPFDATSHYRSVKQALRRDGGHAVVVVADRRGADTDALIETVCDAVTEASRDGSGRDGGVEVVEI